MIATTINLPSKILGLPADEYHARPEWSQSQVKLLTAQPELFCGYHIAHRWEMKQTDDMWLGSCLHAVHLEGREITEIPTDVLTSNGQRRGKLWESWSMEHDGEFCLLAKDAERIRAMSEGLQSDPKCAAILAAPGECEGSYFWTDAATGLPLRARLDKLANFGGIKIVADIKVTSIDVTDAREVASKVMALQYHRQIPWYMDAVEAVTGERPAGGGFIFVRNSPPYVARFWVLSDNDIAFGQRRNAMALADLAIRLKTNHWIGPTNGIENQIVLPQWAHRGDVQNIDGSPWAEFQTFQDQEMNV